MPVLARDTMFYSSGSHSVQLLAVGETILDAPIEFEITPTTQRSAVIGAEWVDQRSRGNAIASLNMCIAIAAELPRYAEQKAINMIMQLSTHAAGSLTWHGGYERNMSASFRYLWEAAIDKMTYHSISHDRIYSADASWVALSLQMTLTHPTKI